MGNTTTYRRGPALILNQVLPAAGAYVASKKFDVRQLEQALLKVVYVAAAITGRPKMVIEGSTDDTIWVGVSVEDMTITTTAEGFQTDVALGIQQWPVGSFGPLDYRINGQFYKSMRVKFAEAGAALTPGTITVEVLGQWGLET